MVEFAKSAWERAAHSRLDLALAIVALVVAILAFYMARKHEQRMANMVGEMSKIAATVPTRMLATFNDHLSEIAGLINATPEGGRIKIMTDCADYGSFFNPKHHGAVVRALAMAKLKGIDVRMLVCGPVQPITQASGDHGKQLSELLSNEDSRNRLEAYLGHLRAEAVADNAFEQWLTARAVIGSGQQNDFKQWLIDNRAFRVGSVTQDITGECLNQVLERCGEVCFRGTATFRQDEDAAFQALLLAREKYFEELLRCYQVRLIRALDRRPDVFFWLRESERKDAAFMFAHARREQPGATMTTVDSNFIEPFISMFDERFNEEPVTTQPNRSNADPSAAI